MAERHIIFVTTHKGKVLEIIPHFERYGIKIIHYDPMVFHIYAAHIDENIVINNICKDNQNINIYAIIREQSNLYKRGTNQPAEIVDFESVEHVSTLNVSMVRNNEVILRQTYTYSTKGTILLKSNSSDKTNIFGWDDIFYLDSCQKNYHQLKNKNFKISSRDMVISQFLKEKIYYKNLIDLKHNPQHFTQSISFDTSGLIQMYNQLISTNPIMKLHGIDKIIKYNFKEGSYVSSPMNRRIKLNWNPGLNPIPLVRKEKDPLHEITYAVHDMGHFAFKPDLTFTGCNASPSVEKVNRKLYIINRMMSEAVTLVFADMFFVKSILDSGNNYETRNERKIYPIFEKIVKNNIQKEDEFNLMKLLQYYKPIWHANVRYCILGDKNNFLQLLNSDSETDLTFDQYDEKYSQFFIQDYRWTNRNYKQMVTDSEYHKKWWKIVSDINDKFFLGLVSIDTFRNSLSRFKIHRLNDGDLVDVIFEYIFNNNIVPIFRLTFPDEIKNNLTKSFMRYLCNQIFIFIKYEDVPHANDYLATILELIDDIYLVRVKTTYGLIENVRSYIKTFLEKCVASNAMTIDDAATYGQLYSLVEPFIVDYNTKYKYSLDVVAKKILSEDDHDLV